MPRLTAEEKEAKKRSRLTPFVPLLNETLDEPAWKALSHGARSLYVALKRRYNVNNHNNGKLWLSQRDAVREIGSHHNEVARWYRELEFYGFIRMMTPGGLGVHGKGKAPHWRLTELGYMNDPPTREFRRWQGEEFKNRKIKARAGKAAQGVRGRARTIVQENTHGKEAECAAYGAHKSPANGAGNGAHTYITTPIASPSLLSSRLFANSTRTRARPNKDAQLSPVSSPTADTETDDLQIPPFLRRTHPVKGNNTVTSENDDA